MRMESSFRVCNATIGRTTTAIGQSASPVTLLRTGLLLQDGLRRREVARPPMEPRNVPLSPPRRD
jgi:hypothetical protein